MWGNLKKKVSKYPLESTIVLCVLLTVSIYLIWTAWPRILGVTSGVTSVGESALAAHASIGSIFQGSMGVIVAGALGLVALFLADAALKYSKRADMSSRQERLYPIAAEEILRQFNKLMSILDELYSNTYVVLFEPTEDYSKGLFQSYYDDEKAKASVVVKMAKKNDVNQLNVKEKELFEQAENDMENLVKLQILTQNFAQKFMEIFHSAPYASTMYELLRNKDKKVLLPSDIFAVSLPPKSLIEIVKNILMSLELLPTNAPHRREFLTLAFMGASLPNSLEETVSREGTMDARGLIFFKDLIWLLTSPELCVAWVLAMKELAFDPEDDKALINNFVSLFVNSGPKSNMSTTFKEAWNDLLGEDDAIDKAFDINNGKNDRIEKFLSAVNDSNVLKDKDNRNYAEEMCDAFREAYAGAIELKDSRSRNKDKKQNGEEPQSRFIERRPESLDKNLIHDLGLKQQQAHQKDLERIRDSLAKKGESDPDVEMFLSKDKKATEDAREKGVDFPALLQQIFEKYKDILTKKVGQSDQDVQEAQDLPTMFKQIRDALAKQGKSDPDVDLFVSVLENNPELAKDALERGADVNVTNKELLKKYKDIFAEAEQNNG